MSNFTFEQRLSDELNAKFNPYFYSVPGKNEITIIENSMPLIEYKLIISNQAISQFLISYRGKDLITKDNAR